MLEFSHVSKEFGKISALEDVSFGIDTGEFVFVTGPSGAGKTTLLKLLIREYVPSSGKIVFDKKDISELKNKEIPSHRQDIGSIFQDFKLLSDRTVAENAQVALAIKKVAQDEWEHRIEHVLELVGLSERADLFPSQLSGGELQRAAIARALVINPKVIFADEPTGNLDWDTTESIVDLLKKISEEGKTVIITTHNKNIVSKLGGRVIELEKGKLKSDSGAKKKKKIKTEKKK